MSSTTTQIAQIETAAVTRRAVCTTGALYGAVPTGTWSAIRKPMSNVDFHDRWPLRSTP